MENKRNIVFEIADWRDYDPINNLYSPKGFFQKPVEMHDQHFKQNMIISPFLQSYEYMVIGFDPIYNVVKIIPHCNFAKKIFEQQYKN